MNKINGNLHATGGHSGTICMRLVANRLQDKRKADKRCVKGRLYILIIFFSIGKSTSLTHASDFSADGPWIFCLENALVLFDDIATQKQICMR
jgi:hypothetical protein